MEYNRDLIKKKILTDIYPYIYFDQKIRPVEEGVVSIGASSLQYGLGAFAGIKGYYEAQKIHIFRLKDHYLRLMNASKILSLDYYMDEKVFKDIIIELVKRNQPKENIYIRPFLFCDQICIVPGKLEKTQFDLGIYINTTPQVNAPLRLKISSFKKFSDEAISTKAKAISGYTHSFLVRDDANQDGYDDGIVMDQNGHGVEVNIRNFFIIYQGEIYTPPIGSSALEGITQRSIKEILKEEGYVVKERNIDRSMLYTCDEMITTGTMGEINWVKSIDKRPIGSFLGEKQGPSEVTKMLQERFRKIVTGKDPLSSKWITTISFE